MIRAEYILYIFDNRAKYASEFCIFHFSGNFVY